MRLLCIAALAVALVTGDSLEAQNRVIERVEIDGKKNPELVPEYAVWRQALRIIPTNKEHLPGLLSTVATDADAALIKEEAERLSKLEPECNARLLKAREPLQKLEEAKASKPARFAILKDIDNAMWSVELECRTETIKSRDRLLGQLSTEASILLRGFVEDIRRGMSFTVSKNGLDRFKQPQ